MGRLFPIGPRAAPRRIEEGVPVLAAGPQDDLRPALQHLHLRRLEAARLGQADRLAAAVPEDLGDPPIGNFL